MKTGFTLKAKEQNKKVISDEIVKSYFFKIMIGGLILNSNISLAKQKTNNDLIRGSKQIAQYKVVQNDADLSLDLNDVQLDAPPAEQPVINEIKSTDFKEEINSNKSEVPNSVVEEKKVFEEKTDTSSIPKNLKVNSDPSVSFGSEDPNYKLEEKFNRVYSEYNKDQTNVETWEKVTGKRASQTYHVQKGDTLWDISETLFGDPYFWPTIWHVNKETIYNPHEIDPKMNIKFYMGSQNNIPSLAMNEKNSNESKTEIDESDVNKEKPETEKETVKKVDRPSDIFIGKSKPLPNSFPGHSLAFKTTPKLGFKLLNQDAKPTTFPLQFVMNENQLVSSNLIKETELNMGSASANQYVYVQVDDPNQKIYTVLKQPKIHTISEEEKKYIYLYEVEGEIEILDKVNSESSYYRAIVKKSQTLVSVGSILTPGPMRKITVSSGQSVSEANSAKIITSLNDYSLMIKNSFVVINMGTQSGYSVGKVLPIYANAHARNKKSIARENQRAIGKLQIADATENYSVGFIIDASAEVARNDLVGARDITISVEAKNEASSSDSATQSVESGETPPTADGEEIQSEPVTDPQSSPETIEPELQ